jgi:two-component system, NarL family, response regulator LiaR
MNQAQEGAPARRIRLLVCDDHRILTETLARVIGDDPGLHLIEPPFGEAEDAVEASGRHHPDVVLMDIEFKSGIDGIEATRRIKQASPTTKVVIMTAHENDRLLAEAAEAGASGFLLKTQGVAEVLGATRAAAAGETLIDPDTLGRLLGQIAVEREARRDVELLLSHLTDREREVLQLLSEGHRNEDIAARLFISPQTVQTHVRNILTKLGVHSKLEAVAFAVKHGAVKLR